MSGYTTLPGPSQEWATIPEVVRAARLRTTPGVWDMLCGGAESEATLRRNRDVMESWAFVPRVLQGVTEPTLATTVLGHPVASPVLLAPVGTIGQYHPDGALAPAEVARQRDLLSFVGILSTPGLAEVAETGAGLVLQIYVRGDRDWLLRTVRAAEEAGYLAVCLSVDSTGAAQRERELHNRFNRPYARSSNLPPGGRGTEHQVRLTWDDVEWLRSITDLPLVIKGLTNPLDSATAVQRGADAVYVSNHGGREMDHLPSTLEVLGEHVAAVGGQAEVLVDSGFVRGSDVVKALALGARAVLVGKLQLWGLMAGGTAGLDRTLELLDHEIAHTLQLLGVQDVRHLTAAHVRRTQPTRRRPPDITTYDPYPIPDL